MDPALRESLPVLTRAFQDCCQLASDSLFEGPGFTMPATPAKGSAGNQVMDYAQVQGFLRMAEEALRARNGAVDLLQSELAGVRAELHALQEQQSKVQEAEHSAQEEAQQLSNLVQQLLVEKAEATTAMQKLQRERQYLSEENALLRHQLTAGGTESGAGDSELSPLAPHVAVLASLHESLEAEQGRAARAEDEAVMLRARVIALEKASVAQQVALVSCIEEGELNRMGMTSPLGILGSPSHWRSDATEEVEREGSEAGSSSGPALGSTPVARRLAHSLAAAASPGSLGRRASFPRMTAQ